MTANDIKNLVDSAKNRDNEAMDKLYKECYRDVYFVCKKYSLNDADAEDITQDTFIQGFEKLSLLDDGTKFRAWIMKIASNKCLDKLKHNKVLTIDSMYDENDEVIDIPDMGKQTEDIVVEKEVKEIIASMMEKLPVEQRVSLFMFYYQNYSISEIAQAYGCSENTVKSRLNYAKKAMRIEAEKLEDKGIKLRVVAILPFLYAFFKSEREALACEIPSSTEVLSQVMGSFVNSGINVEKNMNLSGGTSAVSKTGMAKGLFIKIAAGVVGVAVVGGIIFAISLGGKDNTEESKSNNSNSSSIVSESTTAEADVETTTQEEIVTNENLVAFFARYKKYVESYEICYINGGLSLYCNNASKNKVEQLFAENTIYYNWYPTGTMIAAKADDIVTNPYYKYITYGKDNQLYLYEKKMREYVDGKGREILSSYDTKFTKTPAEKFNMGQNLLEFVDEIINTAKVKDVNETEKVMEFTVTLSGTEVIELLGVLSVEEETNYYLQYSTEKRFADYTYDVILSLGIGTGSSIVVKSDEFVNDLIKAYVAKEGGKAENYTISEDPNYQHWQYVKYEFDFFNEINNMKFYYPEYMDVEASGYNVLVDIYDNEEPYYILLPKEIESYENNYVYKKTSKFIDASDENVTKRIIVDDRIATSGSFGEIMNKDSRYVVWEKPSKDLTVNKTTIAGRNVYYVLDAGNLRDGETKKGNAMCLSAQVEFAGDVTGGDAGYVCVTIEYAGKDSVPAEDGMMETLTYIVENMCYVEVESHTVLVEQK